LGGGVTGGGVTANHTESGKKFPLKQKKKVKKGIPLNTISHGERVY
jgi:hypothetical protein